VEIQKGLGYVGQAFFKKTLSSENSWKQFGSTIKLPVGVVFDDWNQLTLLSISV